MNYKESLTCWNCGAGEKDLIVVKDSLMCRECDTWQADVKWKFPEKGETFLEDGKTLWTMYMLKPRWYEKLGRWVKHVLSKKKTS